jgi:hypothetical protein
LILFASIVMINLRNEDFILSLVILVHLFKSVRLSLVTFLSQISKFILLLIKVLGSLSLVSNCKIFIESLALYEYENLLAYLKCGGCWWGLGYEQMLNQRICGSLRFFP